MEVIILSRYSFASSISDIHLNTSMMTCMGFVFIYWASYFYIFSREGGDISGLILGEVNIESTNALGIMLRWGCGGGYLRECVSSVFPGGRGHRFRFLGISSQTCCLVYQFRREILLCLLLVCVSGALVLGGVLFLTMTEEALLKFQDILIWGRGMFICLGSEVDVSLGWDWVY